MAGGDSPGSHDSGRGPRSGNILPAVIGAAGAIIAALIAALAGHQAGLVNFGTPSHPQKTSTIPPSHATATITITTSPSPAPASPGPGALPGCPAGQGCTAYNLVLQPTAGISLATGSVLGGPAGDVIYTLGENGSPQLSDPAGTASTDGTTRTANQAGCLAALNSAASPYPITNLYAGLKLCVRADNGGTALVTETQPLGPGNTLHLRELYWPPAPG